jgi:hypothetical protein
LAGQLGGADLTSRHPRQFSLDDRAIALAGTMSHAEIAAILRAEYAGCTITAAGVKLKLRAYGAHYGEKRGRLLSDPMAGVAVEGSCD